MWNEYFSAAIKMLIATTVFLDQPAVVNSYQYAAFTAKGMIAYANTGQRFVSCDSCYIKRAITPAECRSFCSNAGALYWSYMSNPAYMNYYDCRCSKSGKTLEEIKLLEEANEFKSDMSLKLDQTCNVQFGDESLDVVPSGRVDYCLASVEMPTSAPSTLFDGQNFTLGEPDVTFSDNGSEFFLNFTYDVGHSATTTNFTIYQKNCISTDEVSGILNIVDQSTKQVDVSVDRKAISVSSLVTKSAGSEGAAKGVISFCIKAESFSSETSVVFLKTNVDLSYDLTQNDFEVTGNTIVENNIEETTTTVSTKYGVRAFRCTTSTYVEDATNVAIQQGSLVAICLEPKANSSAAVDISNFEMKFEQNGVSVLPHPASIGEKGPEESDMSEISKENQTYRVVSRLVTQLFDGGASFNVTGNAYLVFKEQRNLLASSSKALRSVQRSENLAGESSFGMDVQIEKNFEVYENNTSNHVSFLSTIGATLALVIGFTLYKKLG